MTVYIVAQLRFTNKATYDRYQMRFMDIFMKFRGQLLIADEAPVTLEGHWDHEKLVVMSFPDERAVRAFIDDPDYQEISKDRRAGADAVILLAKGTEVDQTGSRNSRPKSSI